MANKKVFMLRVNPEIYEALEIWAADEFRSVNGQLEWAIEKTLKEAGRMPRKKLSSRPESENESETK